MFFSASRSRSFLWVIGLLLLLSSLASAQRRFAPPVRYAEDEDVWWLVFEVECDDESRQIDIEFDAINFKCTAVGSGAEFDFQLRLREPINVPGSSCKTAKLVGKPDPEEVCKLKKEDPHYWDRLLEDINDPLRKMLKRDWKLGKQKAKDEDDEGQEQEEEEPEEGTHVITVGGAKEGVRKHYKKRKATIVSKAEWDALVAEAKQNEQTVFVFPELPWCSLCDEYKSLWSAGERYISTLSMARPPRFVWINCIESKWARKQFDAECHERKCGIRAFRPSDNMVSDTLNFAGIPQRSDALTAELSGSFFNYWSMAAIDTNCEGRMHVANVTVVVQGPLTTQQQNELRDVASTLKKLTPGLTRFYWCANASLEDPILTINNITVPDFILPNGSLSGGLSEKILARAIGYLKYDLYDTGIKLIQQVFTWFRKKHGSGILLVAHPDWRSPEELIESFRQKDPDATAQTVKDAVRKSVGDEDFELDPIKRVSKEIPAEVLERWGPESGNYSFFFIRATLKALPGLGWPPDYRPRHPAVFFSIVHFDDNDKAHAFPFDPVEFNNTDQPWRGGATLMEHMELFLKGDYERLYEGKMSLRPKPWAGPGRIHHVTTRDVDFGPTVPASMDSLIFVSDPRRFVNISLPSFKDPWEDVAELLKEVGITDVRVGMHHMLFNEFNHTIWGAPQKNPWPPRIYAIMFRPKGVARTFWYVGDWSLQSLIHWGKDRANIQAFADKWPQLKAAVEARAKTQALEYSDWLNQVEDLREMSLGNGITKWILQDGDDVLGKPTDGQEVKCRYTGYIVNTAEAFETDNEITFKLGEKDIIPCWNKVVATMALGEKIWVQCPAEQAYGKKGDFVKRSIPPDADLRFKIELLDFF